MRLGSLEDFLGIQSSQPVLQPEVPGPAKGSFPGVQKHRLEVNLREFPAESLWVLLQLRSPEPIFAILT